MCAIFGNVSYFVYIIYCIECFGCSHIHLINPFWAGCSSKVWHQWFQILRRQFHLPNHPIQNQEHHWECLPLYPSPRQGALREGFQVDQIMRSTDFWKSLWRRDQLQRTGGWPVFYQHLNCHPCLSHRVILEAPISQLLEIFALAESRIRHIFRRYRVGHRHHHHLSMYLLDCRSHYSICLHKNEKGVFIEYLFIWTEIYYECNEFSRLSDNLNEIL